MNKIDMLTNLLWAGQEYPSMENCLISPTDNGLTINSTIIGYHEGKIYQVDYCLKTNHKWETIFFEINSRHNNQTQLIRFEGDGKGIWMSEGKEVTQFKGCIDIDIPLTPFTNSLPINRLKLMQDEEQEIMVIYLDLLKQQIIPVRQKYVRISNSEYHYQNVPNDFETIIKVDESGFVVDYPSLFTRKAFLETKK